MKVNLKEYDRRGYKAGAGLICRMLWYILNAVIFSSWLFPVSGIKRNILLLLGARVGEGVVIKPRVNIKYPWRLVIGNNVWIGEGVWIDNLAEVELGNNVCVSQDVYLLTGNHDYKDSKFGLITEKIIIDEGAWLGARSIVCPGVHVSEHVVLSVGSVLKERDTEPFGIYQGNPARMVRKRTIENPGL